MLWLSSDMANLVSKESGQQTIVYLDAKGNLLISIIIHSLLPPSCLCLALSPYNAMYTYSSICIF
jgi:hypothetical protein